VVYRATYTRIRPKESLARGPFAELPARARDFGALDSGGSADLPMLSGTSWNSSRLLAPRWSGFDPQRRMARRRCWEREAAIRQLRKDALAPQQIAQALGEVESYVRWVLYRDRERQRDQSRAWQRRRRAHRRRWRSAVLRLWRSGKDITQIHREVGGERLAICRVVRGLWAPES